MSYTYLIVLMAMVIDFWLLLLLLLLLVLLLVIQLLLLIKLVLLLLVVVLVGVACTWQRMAVRRRSSGPRWCVNGSSMVVHVRYGVSIVLVHVAMGDRCHVIVWSWCGDSCHWWTTSWMMVVLGAFIEC